MVVLFVVPMLAYASSNIDSDDDGISDDIEVRAYHTDPANPDTDGDGFRDGEEVAHGYSPRHAKKRLRAVDSDADGLWDDWEIAFGTNLLSADSDGDGYRDGHEVRHGYDPRSRSRVKLSKRINIDLATQTLRYFFGKTKLGELKISSGLPRTPTPRGTFTVLEKRPVVQFGGRGLRFFYPNTKWNLLFKKGKLNYYIHGAYWHNDFGKPRSSGCVNVPHTKDVMGRLYDWAEAGTAVRVQ